MSSPRIEDWLESLAAKTPTPGGGAVAALSAAIAAAQLGMVAAYTTGPKWHDREKRMQELHQTTASLQAGALGLIQADAEAFKSVGAAYQMPKATEQNKAARNAAIQAALTQAAQPPLQVAELAGQLVQISDELADAGNPNVISDVAVAAAAARAALESAIVNIEVNERDIKDMEVKQSLKEAVQTAATAIRMTTEIIQTVRKVLRKT